MHEHTDRPPVPEPRGRGDDEPWFPLLPAPRPAPAIERVTDPRPVPAPPAPSPKRRDEAPRPTGRRATTGPTHTAPAVRPSRSHTLREWAGDVVRVVARAVGAAVDGLRAALEHLAVWRAPLRAVAPPSS